MSQINPTTSTTSTINGGISSIGQITTTGGNVGIGTSSSTTWLNPQYNGTTGYIQPDYQAKVKFTDTPLTHDYSESEGKTFQHEVAVIKVTRNDSGEVIKSKMVKVFWVETKTQGSIDYAASKDPDVSELEPEDIIIKTLRTIRL
jgi:hypothetical protein